MVNMGGRGNFPPPPGTDRAKLPMEDKEAREYIKRLYIAITEYSNSWANVSAEDLGAITSHADLDDLSYAASGHTGFQATIAGGTYEPAITAGTASQYWKGDKSWGNQSQFEPAITATTSADYYRGDKTFQTLNQAAVSGLKTTDGPSFDHVHLTSNDLVIDTAGKGIDFSANTAASGMTSEKLVWYEEGTWTPTDDSGGSLSFTIGGTSLYNRIGSLVWATAQVTWPSTADANNNKIGGLPFTVNNNVGNRGGGSVTYSATVGYTVIPIVNNTQCQIWLPGTGAPTNATLSGTTVIFSVTYRV